MSAEESKRVTAAREAVADAMVEYGPDGHIDGYEEITDAALGASDAVMFSPDAIERAAQALRATGMGYASAQYTTATVIAALKGDDALAACPPRVEGAKPHCPDCSGIVGATGIVW